jgi:hypothetical protein
MSTQRRRSPAAAHLPVPPLAHRGGSGHEDHTTADHDQPTSAPRTPTDGVDMSREVLEDENTLDFEAAIWFG